MKSENASHREYVPVAQLEDEQKGQLKDREQSAEVLANKRGQLARLLRKYRGYISAPSEESKNLVQQLYEQVLEQGNNAVANFVNVEKIQTEVDKRDVSDRQKQLLKKWKELEVTGALRRMVTLHQELKDMGGTSSSDSDALTFYREQNKEFGYMRKRIVEMREKVLEHDEMLDLAHSDPELTPHPEDLRKVEQEREVILDGLDSLMKESPEAYMAVMHEKLFGMKRTFDKGGRIVETPYVQGKIRRMMELHKQGRPIFIHGELGSGKTELAYHLSRTELSKPHLTRWEETNPKPEEDNKAALDAWEARREKQQDPLFIGGHKGIEIDEMIASRGIERKEVEAPEEQVREVAKRWSAFEERAINGAKVDGISDEGLEELRAKLNKVDRLLFEKAMIDSFQAPVETVTILGPILQAMQEGRPVIIDEMNAIPHHVLILMNDLLNRRVGDTVALPYPGIEPFEVKEGFQALATGNYKPEDGLRYVGRQPIDAAFLSRFGLVSYDYLPMGREIELPNLPLQEQQDLRIENELYHMLVTRLLEDDLSITLPESGFRQLKLLALVARHIQDVFSEKQVDNAWFAEVNGTKVNPTQVLKENVLSLRHMLPIIDQWKADGFKRDLDDYLFLDYIARSSARPEEKLYLYRMLKIQGDFFPDMKGWPKVSDKSSILEFDAEGRVHSMDKRTGIARSVSGKKAVLETHGSRDVIRELFGEPIERKQVPKAFVERTLYKDSKDAEDAEDTSVADRLVKRRAVRRVTDLMKRFRSGLEEDNVNPSDV